MINHNQARELIALREGGALSTDQAADLRAHLATCADCQAFAAAAERLTIALQAEPVPVNAALTRRMQLAVRRRALELRRQRERRWIVVGAAIFVGGSATLTSTLAWEAVPWLEAWTHLPAWAWHAGDSFFWTAPALAAAFVLLARNVDFNFIHERIQD
jgi:hypothetical protein